MSLKLSDFLKYERIVIQCHDNPDADALASGFALRWYLEKQGKKPRFIYGGNSPIAKSNLVLLNENLGINCEYVKTLEAPELLITVDCQYGESNVTMFDAKEIAIIDHHQIAPGKKLPKLCEIRSGIGCCCTVIWDMMRKEKFT